MEPATPSAAPRDWARTLITRWHGPPSTSPPLAGRAPRRTDRRPATPHGSQRVCSTLLISSPRSPGSEGSSSKVPELTARTGTGTGTGTGLLLSQPVLLPPQGHWLLEGQRGPRERPGGRGTGLALLQLLLRFPPGPCWLGDLLPAQNPQVSRLGPLPLRRFSS